MTAGNIDHSKDYEVYCTGKMLSGTLSRYFLM